MAKNDLPRPRIAVVSLHDENQATLAEITAPNHAAYCRRNGYSYFNHVGRIDVSRAASWSKLLLVSRLLPMFHFVLWMDTDTVFTSADRIEDRIIPHFSGGGRILCHQQPAKGPGQESNLNFGVVLFQNTAKTQELIYKIYGQHYQADYPWWEQQAVLSLKEWGMKELDVAPLESFVCYPPKPELPIPLEPRLVYHACGPCDKEKCCRDVINFYDERT